MSVYQLQYNGLTITPADGFTIYRQEGAAGLPIRISMDDLTGADGSVVHKTLYGPRTLTFEGTIHTGTPEKFFDKRSELLAAFSRDGLSHELAIQLWNSSVYTIDAVVTQTPQIIDRVGKRTQIDFQIQLICSDPYFRTGSSEIFTASVQSGGVGFPLRGPLLMPLGNQQTGSTIVINNTGDGAVIPQFRIDGQINTPVVTNLTTGNSFSITTNIPDGRYVNLYVENGDDYVLLDGTTSYYQYFIGEIFPIVPGNNTIRLTATSAGVNALLTINYQNVARGV